MKIGLSAHRVRTRAKDLYAGDSLPISDVKAADEPLQIRWWESQPQDESSSSERQQGAMLLYLELASQARPEPLQDCFPARFDCDGGGSLRPDKAIMKTFLRDGLVTHRLFGWQLIFDLTDAGLMYAIEAGKRGSTDCLG
ncbi:hypothetical protein LZK82_02890 [Rhizobium leguminosarum]|nr:hypothetical protein LZK82_02890 [Rhizobium leguminosarum]UIK11408.1 hypothetical protein LZK80_02875 [Rhizobium leguminosarum]UIL28461.1 hypothetical protein LZK75_02875 [Rhizobium leguminosarum]